MATDQLFRDILRAVMDGDGTRARQLIETIPEEDRQAYFMFLSAVMAGALEHHLGEETTWGAIIRFVNEVRYEFRKADPPINSLVIEGVVRAFYGEDHLLDGMSTSDKMAAAYPIIRSIASRSDHMRDNIDKYFHDAELLAREWTENARS